MRDRLDDHVDLQQQVCRKLLLQVEDKESKYKQEDDVHTNLRGPGKC